MFHDMVCWTGTERQPVEHIDVSENLLIRGDNLEVAKQLVGDFQGKFSLIYVDPPYNTGNSFEHYEDRMDSSRWQMFMRERLKLFRDFLADDGVFVVQIDDAEHAYLQVVMDEVFGREHRLNTVVVKMSELSGVKMAHAGARLPKLKEYLLFYRVTEQGSLRAIDVPKPPHSLHKYLKYYTKLIRNIDDPPSEWELVSIRKYLKAQGHEVTESSLRAFKLQERHRVVYRTNNRYLSSMETPDGIAEVVTPGGTRYISWDGKQMLFLKDYCTEALGDLWMDISTINLNKEGVGTFRNGKKPESLMRRVIRLTTVEGDWVLDPFGGSGTTAAVAHKMGRRWLTIEAGKQATSHALPRLKRVLAGTDEGGVTHQVGWRGGGRFLSARYDESS